MAVNAAGKRIGCDGLACRRQPDMVYCNYSEPYSGIKYYLLYGGIYGEGIAEEKNGESERQ